jgi:hypothetical protein
MARYVVLLRPDIHLHHTHSVIVVLRQYATYNTNPGSALHTLA